MAPGTIVRKAAQAALASAHPVRVMDGDRLVGIVDDDAILRVVVAEESGPTGAGSAEGAPA
jgi:glycine betaine/proline transport system ATP-binding protein